MNKRMSTKLMKKITYAIDKSLHNLENISFKSCLLPKKAKLIHTLSTNKLYVNMICKYMYIYFIHRYMLHINLMCH